MANLREYLLIKEAAEFLGVTPATLRNWERSGKLTTYRHPINGYRLYRPADLEAILNEIQASPASRPRQVRQEREESGDGS